MKQEFLNFIETLIKENPERANELMTENIKAYLDILKDEKTLKPLLTDSGKKILKHLQDHEETKTWKSKDLANSMGVAARSISSSLRKLVNDGFCEKLTDNPSVYTLTNKGKNCKIEEE